MAQIRKMLDLSTAHLPQEVCGDLNGYDGVTAYRMPYGWLLWVPTDPDEHASLYGDPDEYDGVPAAVLAIQRYARELGCDYVLLDSEADKNTDLPIWKR